MIFKSCITIFILFLSISSHAQVDSIKMQLKLQEIQELRVNKWETRLNLTKEGTILDTSNFIDFYRKKVQLPSFGKKTLVLDYWATWCGPCRKQTPVFEELKTQFDSSKFEFISISLDDLPKDWANYVDKNMSGSNIIAGSFEDNPLIWFTYQIITNENGIRNVANILPRYVIIDKDGKIKNNNAPFPSSGELKKYLDSIDY